MRESKEFIKEKFEELDGTDGIFNRNYLLENTDRMLEDSRNYEVSHGGR